MEGVRLSFLWRGAWLHTAAKPHITPCEEECRWTWPSFRGKCEKKRQYHGGNINIWMAFHTTVISQQRDVGCENKDFPEMIYTSVTLEEEATSMGSIWIVFHTAFSSQRRVVGLSRNDLQPCEDGRRGDVMESTSSRGDMWMVFHTAVIYQQRGKLAQPPPDSLSLKATQFSALFEPANKTQKYSAGADLMSFITKTDTSQHLRYNIFRKVSSDFDARQGCN